MEELKIDKANALVAYEQANEKGKALLVNLFGKEVFAKSRFKSYKDIKTLQDAIEYLGEDDEFVKELKSATGAKDTIAYVQLKVIVKAINDGKVMDYNNTNEYKYYPWFHAKGSDSGFSCDVYFYYYSYSLVGSRLCFIDGNRATYAGKQFTDIYDDYIN